MKKAGRTGLPKFLTFVLILIAVAIAYFVWYGTDFSFLPVAENVTDVFSGNLSAHLEIQSLIINTQDNTITFDIKRIDGSGKISGVLVVIEDVNGNKEEVQKKVSIRDSELHTFTVSYTIAGVIAKVTIYPLYSVKHSGFVRGDLYSEYTLTETGDINVAPGSGDGSSGGGGGGSGGTGGTGGDTGTGGTTPSKINNNVFFDDYNVDITGNPDIDQSTISNVLWDTSSGIISVGQVAQTGLVYDDSILGYWSFNDDYKDKSLNGNDGAGNGNLAFTAGKYGNALLFDGNGDYVRIPSVPNPGKSWTVMAWVKPDANSLASGTRGVLGRAADGELESANINNALYLDNNNLRGFYEYGAGSNIIKDSVGILEAGKWYHIAGRRNDFAGDVGTFTIFINGVRQDTTSVEGLDTSDPSGSVGGVFAIGRNGDIDNEYYSGAIDDVALFSRPLSDAEIADVYNNGFAVSQQSSYGGGFASNSIITGEVSEVKVGWSESGGQGVKVEVNTGGANWCVISKDVALSDVNCPLSQNVKYRVTFSDSTKLNSISVSWVPKIIVSACGNGIKDGNEQCDGSDF